jgi:hypothetical protein
MTQHSSGPTGRPVSESVIYPVYYVPVEWVAAPSPALYTHQSHSSTRFSRRAIVLLPQTLIKNPASVRNTVYSSKFAGHSLIPHHLFLLHIWRKPAAQSVHSNPHIFYTVDTRDLKIVVPLFPSQTILEVSVSRHQPMITNVVNPLHLPQIPAFPGVHVDN